MSHLDKEKAILPFLPFLPVTWQSDVISTTHNSLPYLINSANSDISLHASTISPVDRCCCFLAQTSTKPLLLLPSFPPVGSGKPGTVPMLVSQNDLTKSCQLESSCFTSN